MSNSMAAIKGVDGWKCETHYPLGDDGRTLKVTTRRDHRGTLTTSAICIKIEPRGGVSMFIWEPFSDFSSTLAKSAPRRVTPRIAEEQHASAVANIEAVKAEAIAFYAAKAAA